MLQSSIICSKWYSLESNALISSKNPSESLQNDELSMCTNFGSNQCITFQIIQFAANYTILQHFVAT